MGSQLKPVRPLDVALEYVTACHGLSMALNSSKLYPSFQQIALTAILICID